MKLKIMPELRDFHAKGVSFPDTPRPDIDTLTRGIPDLGTLHLAVLQQPYLDLIADGTKTIESRFNTKRAAPFGKVAVGDLVLLKEPGRPIMNFFYAAGVRYIDLSQTPIGEVRASYGARIQPEDADSFWKAKIASKYCTLVEVGERGVVSALPITKKDQRGWVTFALDEDAEPLTLF